MNRKIKIALLCAALRERGFRVRELSFPMYGEKSAVPVELYLGGALWVLADFWGMEDTKTK